mmetsp:Transcript_18493/g.26585  ORF Transcript_18493/g.26585 Transcript_18493/m.26585 type:complete len:184 (-) Transcript_18493:254-805(-)
MLKKIVMRRMWRLKPDIRERVCSRLESYGLGKEFITFSIRRGDKVHEQFAKLVGMDQYINAAEVAIVEQFGGVPPSIFVATDDCQIMSKLREIRPGWRFVSECDEHDASGFDLRRVRAWNEDETDEHFYKFFTELYAMASAKYFIGVAYTNVSWWAFFMRQTRHNFVLLDAKHGCVDCVFNHW